jgi:hypothetical protein
LHPRRAKQGPSLGLAFVDTGEQYRPQIGRGRAGCLCHLSGGCLDRQARRMHWPLHWEACASGDRRTQWGIGGQGLMIAVTVVPWGWDEGHQPLQELQGRERQHRLPVRLGLGGKRSINPILLLRAVSA